MEIDQATKLKLQAQKAIENIILAFQTDTGLKVDGLNCDVFYVMGGPPKHNVRIEVTL